jgi:adenylate cyclase class 2
MALETEVKIYLPNLGAMQRSLESAQAGMVKPRLFERNLRYENAERSLAPNGIVLRLRQDDRGRITYKGPAITHEATGISTRAELETEIGDITIMDAILQKLGFQVSLIYEKYRTTYELHGAEIVLDEMPYGNFMEIEGESGAIEQVLHMLNLSETPRIIGSYVVLFEAVKTALGLDFRDLSFANFAGIHVPAEIFYERSISV